MPRKGMRSIFFHSSPPPSSSGAPPPSSTLAIDTFRATLMEDNISSAEQIITKWDPDGSNYSKITSLFYESRGEARRFLRSVLDLHQAMHFFSGGKAVSSSSLLVRAQRLMQVAMARLQKELYQILAANRDRLDPDSVSSARSSLSTITAANSLSDLDDDEFFDRNSSSAAEDQNDEDAEIRAAGDTLREVERPPTAVMANLRSIAETMIATGYAKECVEVYKSIRRSIVDEGLSRLGFEKLNPTQQQLQKLDWDSAERRIKTWISASGIAIRTLFSGERMLCDFVFGSSGSIKEACFAEITRDAAVEFLAFPEVMTTKAKRTPDKIFLFLDMYNSVAELWPQTESVFSYESTTAVHTQVLSTLLRLGEAVRSMIADFEATIQKDASKTTVPGGGLHPLTLYAMEYMTFLANYDAALVDMFVDYPLPTPRSPLPEPFQAFIDAASSSVPSSPSSTISGDYDADIPPSVSARVAWLLLVLLCKLDVKAELYKDASLAYLFLANNLQYIVAKVRRTKLSQFLGREWVAKHEQKARAFLRSYERLAWTRVVETIPSDPAGLMVEESGGVATAMDHMKRFNKAFEEAYRKQKGWVVVDGRMREELRASIARKVVGPYRAFYDICGAALKADRDAIGVVRFAPDDLERYLAGLFSSYERSGSSLSRVSSAGSSSSSGSGSGSGSGSRSGSSKAGRWRSAIIMRLRR